MTGEGQQPHHAELRPYASVEEALRGKESTPFTRTLDGDWQIRMSDLPEQVPDGFWKPGYDTSRWKTVAVPHTWQTDGLDHPMYRNTVEEIWPDDPPKVPRDVNPTAAYVKNFFVPDNWRERRTFLRFEGVTAGYFVWVNGKYAGFDQGGYTPAEFDVTDLLVPGRNKVALQVHRWGAGSYLEDYDQWRYSGIFRSAWLYSAPDKRIRDVSITTKGPVLTADLDLTAPGEVWGGLYDAQRRLVAEARTTDSRLVLPVRDPLPWTDETPNLYTLVLKLDNGFVTRETTGFRDITIADRQLKINGKRVMFKGVNRAEVDPDHGRHVPRANQRRDVDLMKSLHINAVRTSHYPSDPHFYDLADERGLWVADEMDVETHSHENCPHDCLADRPEWSDAFLERFVAMVERDKNHPSIFMWDTGNEAGLGAAHFRMAEWAKANEPTRPLYHQPNRPSGDAPFAHVWGPRYPSPEKFATQVAQTTKPLIMGEYAHAMGNSLGNFREFWDIIRANPQAQGGFIWDWAEQNIRQPLRISPDSASGILAHVTGLPSTVEGHRGKALKFSGLDDFVEVYRDPKLDLLGPLTLDAWVKPSRPFTDFTIIAKGNQYGLRMANEKTLEFYAGGKVQAPVPADFYDRFHRVTGKYEGGMLKLLIDDVEVASVAQVGPVPRSSHPVNVGRNAETMREKYVGRMAHGVIDEVKISAGDKVVLALDFDREERRGTYLSHGQSVAGVDGVVDTERNLQPETAQLKWVHQPVRFSFADGVLTAASERVFAPVAGELRWKVIEGSRTVRTDRQRVEIAPSGSVRVPVPPSSAERERWLNVELVVDGEVYAHDQFSLGGKPLVETPVNGAAAVEQTDSEVVISGPQFRYVVEKATGALTSMRVRGVELLHGKGTKLDVWRAPLSNETADWGTAEANQWRAAGLDRLSAEVSSVDVTGSKITVRATSSAPDVSDAAFDQMLTYDVDAKGVVKIDHEVVPTGRMRTLPYLPRMGLAIPVADRFGKFSWYGRGPGESFVDRKDGTPMGVWRSTVDKEYVPYDRPQDNGNHTDTRWALLTDGWSGGLMVLGAPDVSVSRYDELDRAEYGFQRRRNAGWTTLHANSRVTGVGDTPNPVRPHFQVRPDRTHSNVYTIRPLSPLEVVRGIPIGA